MTKAKKEEKFTVKDFKMWLKGMAEFQEANWTPNLKQWKTILSRVEQLEEEVVMVNNALTTPYTLTTTATNPHVTQESGDYAGGQPSARRFPDAQSQPAKSISDGGLHTAGTVGTNGGIDVDITKPGSFV